jgi:hypothetical protein
LRVLLLLPLPLHLCLRTAACAHHLTREGTALAWPLPRAHLLLLAAVAVDLRPMDVHKRLVRRAPARKVKNNKKV